ncbi:MAG: Gfo/Idh/MocA family oxidoreductase [Opitutales bacterium]
MSSAVFRKPRKEGLNYAPEIKAKPVVEPGEFVFASAFLNHGHIYGQTEGLKGAGGVLKYVYEPDAALLDPFIEKFPEAEVVDSYDRILDNPEIKAVTAAAIPNERGPIGLRTLDAGKDYLTDKAPFTTLEQLSEARAKVAETGFKYMVCYSERFLNECTWRAGELIAEGVLGRVLHLTIAGPHRLSKDKRPDWFFRKEQYGGIITDIMSHQFEQFLCFTGETDATINFARAENFANPDKPELEDFGEVSLTGAKGASAYCRADWFTPDGLRTWGDGRVFIVGTEASMELRKYVDVARDGPPDKIFLVDGKTELEIDCAGKVGFPFFGHFILDCLHRTEQAMTQEHAFKAAELSLQAQKIADEAKA